MSTTTLALIIGGAVVVVLGIGVVGIALFFFLGRRPPDLGSRGVSVEPATPRGPLQPLPGGGRAQGGTKARLIAVSATPLDSEGVRGAVASATTRIDSCFVGTELEPPNHETAAYDLDVTAAGVVTRADAPEKTNRCAKLDACMTQTLRSVRMPKSPSGGPVRLTFAARITDLQQTR